MWQRLYGEEEGAVLVEYAALITGITMTLMLAILAFSSVIRDIFLNVVGLFRQLL